MSAISPNNTAGKRTIKMKTHVQEIIRLAGVEEEIGVDHFYPSVQGGVDAFLAQSENDRTDAELSAAE